MKTIHQIYTIKAPLGSVWQALVDPAVIAKWGAGPAVMTSQGGSAFSLWGGDIKGTNLVVVPPNFLEQHWTSGNWPKPSRVIMKLSEQGNVTTIDLTQTDFPDAEEAGLIEGWRDFYFGPIKQLLEIPHMDMQRV